MTEAYFHIERLSNFITLKVLMIGIVLYLMQLVVQSTCITHGLTGGISPPQRGFLSSTVVTGGTLSLVAASLKYSSG